MEVMSRLEHQITDIMNAMYDSVNNDNFEESPDVTTAQLRNKIKCFKAGRATAKYIKSSDAKEVHQIKKTKKHKKPWSKQGTKPQNDFGKNNQGQKNNNW